MDVRRERILDSDPDLARGLGPEEGERLREQLTARVVRAPMGAWDPRALLDEVPDGLGLLLLEGTMFARLAVAGRGGAEVMGPGDVLGTWAGWEAGSLGLRPSGHVVRPMRLALLDRQVSEVLTSYPVVLATLLARTQARGDRLLTQMAIVRRPHVTDRVILSLWALADRWGRVTPRGTELELRLTHERIADLVAAQRPSVTLALRQLEEEGRLLRVGSRAVLLGPPPVDAEADDEPGDAVAV